MPRSFLVKKKDRKCHRPEDVLRAYAKESLQVPAVVTELTNSLDTTVIPFAPTIQPLAVRLTNGYIHDVFMPHVRPTRPDSIATSDGGSSDEENRLEFTSSLLPPSPPPTPHRRNSTFQDGVTVGYTYEAFFMTDGRSRQMDPLVAKPNRPRYSCNECGKHYATSSNLSRHKQTHRSLDSQQAKHCPHCSKVYVSMPALSMHILTHDLKHSCTVCGKTFSRPWLLQGHMRSHTGQKPYGCAHCGKAFADRSNLRAHMQTHSTLKHYKCQRCNKCFALKSYLNKHYESACFKDEPGALHCDSADTIGDH